MLIKLSINIIILLFLILLYSGIFIIIIKNNIDIYSDSWIDSPVALWFWAYILGIITTIVFIN